MTPLVTLPGEEAVLMALLQVALAVSDIKSKQGLLD